MEHKEIEHRVVSVTDNFTQQRQLLQNQKIKLINNYMWIPWNLP